MIMKAYNGLDINKTVRYIVNFIATPAVWSIFTLKGNKGVNFNEKILGQKRALSKTALLLGFKKI